MEGWLPIPSNLIYYQAQLDGLLLTKSGLTTGLVAELLNWGSDATLITDAGEWELYGSIAELQNIRSTAHFGIRIIIPDLFFDDVRSTEYCYPFRFHRSLLRRISACCWRWAEMQFPLLTNDESQNFLFFSLTSFLTSSGSYFGPLTVAALFTGFPNMAGQRVVMFNTRLALPLFSNRIGHPYTEESFALPVLSGVQSEMQKRTAYAKQSKLQLNGTKTHSSVGTSIGSSRFCFVDADMHVFLHMGIVLFPPGEDRA